MTTNVTEAITGGVVLAVAAGFLVYSSQFGGFGGGGSGNAMYTASFRSAEGVGIGTDVRLAGVKVGSITSLELDPTTFRAEAALSVDDAFVVWDCGEYEVGSAFDLEPGSEIEDTQSSVSIVQLLLRFVSGDGE